MGGDFKQQCGFGSPLYKCVPSLRRKVFFPSILTSSSSPPKTWCPCVCKLYHPPRLLWCYYVKAACLVAPGIIYNLGLQSNPGMGVCICPLSSLSLFVCWDGSRGGSILCRARLWLGPPGAFSGLVGTRSPLLRARLLRRCVACYFRTWGCILGSDEPWKTRSCSSPPGTGLSAAC